MEDFQKITLVIPIYQPQLEYLRELFVSIGNQDYPNFNVVISDDGDGESMVWKVMPDHLASRVKYVSNAGSKGIFRNLNHALLHAEGDFIQLFCQDDVMFPSLLSKNYASFVQHPNAVISFTLAEFQLDSGEKIEFDYSFMRFIPDVLTSEIANNYLLYYGCLPGNLSNVMMRRTLVEKLGKFDETFAFAADYDYWIRASKFGDIVVVKEPHLTIRNHQKSASIEMGTLHRYVEIKEIYQRLIEANSMPFEKRTLIRHIHKSVFRSVVSYFVRKKFRITPANKKELSSIFNGHPYSFWTAFLVFLVPTTRETQKLKMYMENIRINDVS